MPGEGASTATRSTLEIGRYLWPVSELQITLEIPRLLRQMLVGPRRHHEEDAFHAWLSDQLQALFPGPYIIH